MLKKRAKDLGRKMGARMGKRAYGKPSAPGCLSVAMMCKVARAAYDQMECERTALIAAESAYQAQLDPGQVDNNIAHKWAFLEAREALDEAINSAFREIEFNKIVCWKALKTGAWSYYPTAGMYAALVESMGAPV